MKLLKYKIAFTLTSIFCMINAMEDKSLENVDLLEYYQKESSAYKELFNQKINGEYPKNNSLNENFYHQRLTSLFEMQKNKYKILEELNTLDGPEFLIITSESLGFKLNPSLGYGDNQANKSSEKGDKHLKAHVALVRQKSNLLNKILYDIYSGKEKVGYLALDPFLEKSCITIEDIEIDSKYQNQGFGLAALSTMIEFLDSNPKIFNTAKKYFLRDAVFIKGKEVKRIYEKLGFFEGDLKNAHYRPRRK